MEFPAVQLDDELAIGPGEVDVFPLDDGVGLGQLETAVIEEGVEASLEVGSGVGGWGERAEGFGASLGPVALCELVRAFEAEDLGLVDGLLQLMALEHAGEVEEGAGGGGDRDAVPHRDLVFGENGSVKEEARAFGSRPRGRDVDPAL